MLCVTTPSHSLITPLLLRSCSLWVIYYGIDDSEQRIKTWTPPLTLGEMARRHSFQYYFNNQATQHIS